MKKITFLKSFSFLITCLCVVAFGFGQSIFTNPITDANPNSGNPYTSGQTIDANITVSGIGRGVGAIGANANNRYNARSWNTGSIDLTAYFEFTITPNASYEIDFSSFVYTGQMSPTGPTSFAFRSSLDGYTADIGSPSAGGTTIDLSSATYQNITSAITFRLYAWGASSASGTFSVNDFTFNAVVLPTCTGVTTTWNGSSWDNGAPGITTAAIINDNYSTTTSGSFSACSLTVNNTSTLTVNDNTYIEIQNNIAVDAGSNINVQPYGSVIQNDDAISNVNNGTISVTKQTSPLAAWYEYTYWSSPVSGTTIQDALTDSDVNRRFSFNAANFEDSTMETGNNNASVAGQDDIDDNGDDWTFVSGTTVMTPGVGYASTHEESVFIGPGPGGGTPPFQFNYIFTGDFNNGDITVPVVRNDGSSADNNWNFIGNPYPSAISVSDFFTQNIYDGTTNPTGTLEGAIYYWSQNTPPSNSNNGNQQENFATSDYAMRNGVTGTAGGDGVAPNAYIPSGQGFFVLYAQARPSSSGDVIFNNAMRGTTHNNSQFFKNSNTKKSSNVVANKLWIDLTSDNGVFNQIAIGYVEGATDIYDGSFYDAHKIVAPNVYASLYSTIENSNKKFAIQGKTVSSLNEDEVIKLGFKTIIDVATLYKLSLADFEGNFLANNPVYLKDNLLNKLHNLSDSDYTFTSEVGEFNNRFEVVFNSNALSVENKDLKANTLRILELDNDYVQFNVASNSAIKSINIFDLLGRQLYGFKGNSSSETYKLDLLNDAVYIAKVELSNGAIITKKAVKK